jgi:hypothetical protein
MLVGELVGIAVGCGANTPHPDKVTKMSKAWNGFMKRLLSHPLILEYNIAKIFVMIPASAR